MRRDPSLRRVVRLYGPPPLWARRTGFRTLARVILEQQVSLASGKAIFERLDEALGRITPERVARLGTRGLRRLGVTRQKSAYLVDLAHWILDRRLDLAQVSRLPDEEARAMLQQVKGIGPWTADVYLLMAMRRPDVWPEGDLALHVAMEKFLRLRSRPTKEKATQIARRWRPWRAVAARILWHGYLENRMIELRRPSSPNDFGVPVDTPKGRPIVARWRPRALHSRSKSTSRRFAP